MQASLHSAAGCRRAAAAPALSPAAAALAPSLPSTLRRRALHPQPSASPVLVSAAAREQHQHRQPGCSSSRRPALSTSSPSSSSRRAPRLLLPPPSAAAAGAASSSSSFGGEDPYKVLGIPPDADNNAINRAFRVKKFEARGNDAETARLEAAHSALMMAALASRVRAGAGAVPAEVRFADREPLFPWRPKRWDATPKVVLAVGAIQLALAFFGLQSPQFSKIVGSGLIGVAGNVLKANAIAPPPRNPETATEEEQGRSGRNFVRGLLLGLMATVGGMLIFSLPEAAVTALNLTLPAWVPTGPAVTLSVRIAGVAFCNWLITSFFY
jgi:hypothetical protein